jgi:RimJ/RimL family protein N-acetyltransferase
LSCQNADAAKALAIMAIAIRKLDDADGAMLRAFWLQGLAEFPVFFGRVEDIAIQPPGYWRNVIRGQDHQIFGLFDSGRMIGITAAFAFAEDQSGETAIFGMSFIAPEYRGLGLSRLLYDARLAWTRARPRFKRVILSHAVSNEASRRAHRRYGFVLIEKKTLADTVALAGLGTEPEEYYEIAV